MINDMFRHTHGSCGINMQTGAVKRRGEARPMTGTSVGGKIAIGWKTSPHRETSLCKGGGTSFTRISSCIGNLVYIPIVKHVLNIGLLYSLTS